MLPGPDLLRAQPQTWHREAPRTPVHDGLVHDGLVQRDFTADAPNQLWLTDITEHHTNEGRLRTYHRRRRQRTLGKLTPIEFATIYAAADAT